MSAGFSLENKVFWGSNGAVESCLEVMAARAADQLGPDDPLAVFLRNEREQFYMGKVVFINEWADDVSRRRQLLELVEAATHEMLHSGILSDYGKEWASSVMAELCACLAQETPPKRNAFY